ncbi:hypothetical protein HA466_0056930 [Hirschfeldia incana]|nr:hypothetical protein HA466_0056930 [Hirschfeldia incana]
MTPNLRSLVAKAYRVRQGRTFSSSSSSSAPNPIGDKGGSSIVTGFVSRCLIVMAGFSLSYYMTGDDTDKFEEAMKADEKDAWDTLAKKREEFYLDKEAWDTLAKKREEYYLDMSKS